MNCLRYVSSINYVRTVLYVVKMHHNSVDEQEMPESN